VFEWVEQPQTTDLALNVESDLTLYVDGASVEFVKGCLIDYDRYVSEKNNLAGMYFFAFSFGVIPWSISNVKYGIKGSLINLSSDKVLKEYQYEEEVVHKLFIPIIPTFLIYDMFNEDREDLDNAAYVASSRVRLAFFSNVTNDIYDFEECR
jgi:hypothetical protein